MGPKMQMKRLIEERDKLAAEIEAKKNELHGLNRAIALLSEGGGEDEATSRRRMAIKDGVLSLLAEYRETGLTAAEVVEFGKARGSNFDRASVSSLLSRLKRDGVLTLDQATSKYKIAASPQQSATTSPTAQAPTAATTAAARPATPAMSATPAAIPMPPRQAAPQTANTQPPGAGKVMTVADALMAVAAAAGRK